jgi:hypothetical protein
MDAILDRSLRGKIEIPKDLEHFPVLIEDERHQLSNTARSRKANEMPQEQRAHAAALILVCDRNSDFRAVTGGGGAYEATNRDQFFARHFLYGQSERNVIAEIDLGQMPKVLVRQRRDRMKEPPIDTSR